MVRMLILTLLALFFLNNCKGKKQIDDDSLKVSVSKTAKLKKIREFVLKEDTYLLGNISQWNNYITRNGDLYIVDQKNRNVVHYDSLGRFVGVVGKKGHGPGEYARPLRVSVDADGLVYIGDTERSYEVVYDKNNRFVTEFRVHEGKLYPGGMRFADEVRVVCAYVYTGCVRYENVNLFHVYDSKNNLLRRIRMNYPEKIKEWDDAAALYPHWFIKNNLIYIAYFPLSKIYIYDLQGKQQKVYNLSPEFFKQQDKKVKSSMNKMETIKAMSQSGSNTHSLQDLGNNYIFYSYYNEELPENFKIYDLWKYRTYYYEVIDEDGYVINTESSKLPGGPIGYTDGALLYILSEKSDSRTIGVYKIEIREN